jgi:uncharacterized protein
MQTRTRNLLIAGVVALLVVLVGGRLAAEFLVDLLWFESTGYTDVFWARRTVGIVVRLTLGLVIGAFVFVNLWVVSRSLGSVRVRRRYGNIEIAERLPQSYIVGALLALSFLSAWWLSAGVGDPIALYAALSPEMWGLADPVHGRDAAFYVFQYPVLVRLQVLTGVVIFWTLLLAGIAYVAMGSARWTEAGAVVTPGARRHLGLLVAGLLAVFAASLWLDRYELMMSGQGVGGALGYTDVHARIPARVLLAGLAAITAGAVAYGAWYATLRPPVAAGGLLILGFIGGQLIYPSALQNLRVEPDEFAREAPFIEQNLSFTWQAYGLSNLQRTALPYRAGQEVNAEAVAERLEGVPLWDRRPLLQTFRALQAPFRPYFDFVSVHYDRYGPPGQAQQVAIAVRETDVTRLQQNAQTWQNLHLNYVRGEGAVVTPVSQMTAGGEPRYFVSDLDPLRIAPDAPDEVRLSEPGVYFGELTRGYVVLNPVQRQEAQMLAPGSPPPTGVRLDSWWRKLAFAWAFQSRNILLSGELGPQSEIVYRRTVLERARSIAPFLQMGGEGGGPYPVIFEGRVVWVIDAYTSSTHFPLAPPVRFADRSVRYVRNSVKVTVDGVSGEVRLYVVDDVDPILRTYARIFPSLFAPVSDMPPGLRRHLRVPPPLFALQAAVLQEYHLRDARDFYNRNDVWQIPTETYRDRAVTYEPFFAMLPLPGGGSEREFLLTMPFVAAGRQNMTAMLIARNDPPYYGETILFELPRDELIPGPQQVESLIDQDPAISEQLALWKRGGSDVIRGHMTVVPVEGTLVYVEPLFLEAQESAIPQLERVVLASGRRVVMRPTPQSALAALLGDDGVGDERRGRALAAAPGPAEAQPVGAPRPAELDRARRLMDQADAQLRAGDWAAFGQTWSELRGVLRSNAAAVGPP